MKKRPSPNRRSAVRAKCFVAALCVAFGWGAASLTPTDSTLGAAWRFRFESFALFSTNAHSRDEDRPFSYLDASGRRVVFDAISTPRLETSPTFVAESTELLANAVLPLETEPIGATFDEAESESESEPVSFATADAQTPVASAPLLPDGGWLVVDENAEERDEWSRELRLEAFPEPTFAESSAPTWRDDVPIVPATVDELRALEFEPGVVASSLVSSSLRRRAANARLVSGDYSFVETSSVGGANEPQTSSFSVSTPEQTPAVAPTRVGAFTACGTFDSNGVAKVRVQ